MEEVIIKHKVQEYRLQFYFLLLYYLSGDHFFGSLIEEEVEIFTFLYKNKKPLIEKDENKFKAFDSLLNDEHIDELIFSSAKAKGIVKISYRPLIQSIQKLIRGKYEELLKEHSEYFYQSSEKKRKARIKGGGKEAIYYDPKLFSDYCNNLSSYFQNKNISKNISNILAGWILFFTGRISLNEDELKRFNDGLTYKKWRTSSSKKKSDFEFFLGDKIKASIRQNFSR